MRRAPVSLGLFAMLPFAITAAKSPAVQRGYVVIRSDPLFINALGVGPGVCFVAMCPPGVILRNDGSGALLRSSASGPQEILPFTFDRRIFQELAADISRIRHRGLPCKMLATDGGSASVFWSIGQQRIEVSFVNGCPNKDDAPVLALYERIMTLPEVLSALANLRQ